MLGAMTLVAAGTFSYLSIARHEAFQSHAFDLGNMDQAAWNTIHGSFLRFTDMSTQGRVLTTRLAIHVEPLLAVISLLYFLHAGPETLLLVQAVVVCSGAIPAYLVAGRALGRDWLPLVFPLAYLLHPSLQNALLDDFHTVTLSACFLLWALYFSQTDRMLSYAIFAVLAISTKEEIGLLVAALGIWLLVRRRRYAGFLSVVGGLGWFLFSVLIIIPSANPAGHSPYLSRYAYLGHGLGGILLSPVRHPTALAHTLTSVARLDFLSDLFHPFGFVSLLGMPVVLLSLPALAINMLSSDPRMYSGFYQYPVEILPYVATAAAFGSAWTAREANRRRVWRAEWIAPVVCALVLVASVVDTWEYGFSPLARGYIVPSAGSHQALENRVLDRIPASAVVAAADEIEPHVAHRRWVYLLPTVRPRNGPAAAYVALDASTPSVPVTPRSLHHLTGKLLHDGYGIVAAQDGVLLLRSGATSRRLPTSFYSFIFQSGPPASRISASWGPLHLIAIAAHPRTGALNRSRPAAEIEAFWRTEAPLPPGTRIEFLMSPVYSGSRPPFSSRWRSETDSPTWDWLPLAFWPADRSIRTASLDMVPAAGETGHVDIAVRVSGLGPTVALHHLGRVRGCASCVRVATMQVDG